MIISTVLSEKPLIEGNSVTLPIVKVGTLATDSHSKKRFKLTRQALESGADTWTGGIVTVNHMIKEKGTIVKSWFEDPFVYATFEGLPQEMIDSINSPAYRGVSQESIAVETDNDNNVLKLNGTGSTFVFYPFKPACSKEDGCGLPIASCDPSFNFPLYTNLGKLESNTPGGVNIADDEIKELKSTISKLEGEKDDLKSTVDGLRQEIKNKDSKMQSTVEAAVKAALESHDLKLKEQSEMAAAVTELKSCMSEETATEFLKAEPSVAIIKSTVSAIKTEAGKNVGASGGKQLNSTDDGGSLSGLYLGGE